MEIFRDRIRGLTADLQGAESDDDRGVEINLPRTGTS